MNEQGGMFALKEFIFVFLKLTQNFLKLHSLDSRLKNVFLKKIFFVRRIYPSQPLISRIFFLANLTHFSSKAACCKENIRTMPLSQSLAIFGELIA